tara:strand:- start:456 stop:614 length:159 start_codon:yes stop_codon:yes gene_type:complete
VKIVDIDELEKKLFCAQHVLAEVAKAVHKIQEALALYEKETRKEVKESNPPF